MIKKIIGSKTAGQTIFLFIAQLFGMVVGFVSNMLLAKQMGASNFGIYSLSLAIIIFVSIFFEFGYFASAAKILATNQDIDLEKKIFGASIIIACIIVVFYLIFTFAISFLIDIIFDDNIGYIVRIASLISWSLIIPFFMELILKGSNHIEYMAGFNIISKILFIAFLFILFFLEELTPLNALLSFSTSYAFVFVLYIFLLHPDFSNISGILRKVNLENKSYGIHIYIGRVIDVSTYNIDRLLIGYFIGSKDVGFYGLANSMATPIYSFSAAMSSSLFKKLANDDKIPSRVLKANLIWVFLAFILANLLGFIIIKFYLGNEYNDVFIFLLLMSVAVCFQALYQPYNAWISGHGFGRELKRMSFKMAIINFVGNVILIPLIGVVGAILTSIVATLYYLYASMLCYKRAGNAK
ncbi:oligosaccharide flippase family protein [Campylobacter mucosalis]|uniref:oligosaccharide flippase family protein n=1 Tax=Campylobacter mucosalis TaxID=202 RepID=UPI0014701F61|nr:oligosaccharide flippase family protein [Campylobacter mucosalis]